MRKVLGAVLALMISTAAYAADKGGPSYPADPMPAPQTAADWWRSGFYMGLAAGYNVAQLSADDFHFSNAAMTGGILGGFNVNMGSGVVLGMEADYMLTGIKGSTSTSGYSITASNHFLASVRARAGLTLGPAMLYATAGPAFTERKAAIQTGPFVSEMKDLQIGAVFGGGLESEITRTMSLRIEALHYMFPDKDVDGSAGFFKSQNAQTTARAAIVFRLN